MITLIEATVIAFLSQALGTEHVYAERPEILPDEYYVIERTGSGEINHIRRATVAIQSISCISMLRAAQMNDALLRVMPQIVQQEDLSSCKLNSAYNHTDTETRQYRYQAVYDLYYMEGEEET